MDTSLFALASQKASWLSQRQNLVSQNVANANTPGYKVLDMPDFASTLRSAGASPNLTTTNAAHINATETPSQGDAVEASESDIWDGTHSQNNVSLEQEMIKAGDVRSDFSLNAGIIKSFQSMILSSLKG